MALAAALTVQPHLYIGDPSGRPLDNGSLYFGEPDKDPQEYPIDLFYDPSLTVAAAQPVKTKGGFMYANGNMIEIYAAEQSYSVKVLDAHGQLVFYKPAVTRTIDSKTTIKSNSLFIAPPNNDNGVNVFEYRDAVDLIWTIVPAGVYLKDNVIAKASITGDKIVKGAQLNEPNITNPTLLATYALTTLDAPNLTLAVDGTLKRSNDPLNASTRKVGTVAGNLVERGADGYPTNNNAVGISQSWQNMAGSRVSSTSYLNSTGRTIAIVILGASAENKIQASVDGSAWIDVGVIGKSGSANAGGSALIPSGHYYRLINGIFSTWSELR